MAKKALKSYIDGFLEFVRGSSVKSVKDSYRFRTAMLIAIICLNFITCWVIGVVYNQYMTSKIAADLSERAIKTAVEIERNMNVEAFVQYAETGVIDDRYATIQRHYKLLDDVSGAEAIYAMVPHEGTIYRYIYDSTDMNVLTSPLNDEVGGCLDDVASWTPPNVLEAMRMGIPVKNEIHYNEKYGTLLSAFAPIEYNNEVIGVVGVDYSIDFIQAGIKSDWDFVSSLYVWMVIINAMAVHLTVGAAMTNFFRKQFKDCDCEKKEIN